MGSKASVFGELQLIPSSRRAAGAAKSEAGNVTPYQIHATHAMDARLALADDPENEILKAAMKYHELQAARLKRMEDMTDITDNARPLGPWQAWPGDSADLAPTPQDDPRVAALLDALRNVVEEYDRFRKDEYERGLSPLDDEIHDARAALAAFDTTAGGKDE